MRKYTKDYADEIIEMLKSGMNYSQIGREVGIGYNAIAKFANSAI